MQSDWELWEGLNGEKKRWVDGSVNEWHLYNVLAAPVGLFTLYNREVAITLKDN